MKTYRVGVIGFGYIGKVHAFAHKNLPFFFGNLPFRTRITQVKKGSTGDLTLYAKWKKL